ncbi:hypothetical protein NC651_039401 [Populus alba x Populus x berolinensis]|nr:hypothetical protein NC651_039401 [Populus alba x Populus x berolinensis]
MSGIKTKISETFREQHLVQFSHIRPHFVTCVHLQNDDNGITKHDITKEVSEQISMYKTKQ